MATGINFIEVDMSLHFKHSTEKYYVTTNLKVWYSTLTFHKELVRPTNFSIFLNSLKRRISSHLGLKHYYLVRNPYDRLESFYRDKLFNESRRVVYNPGFQWQNCQNMLLREFGNTKWTFEEQRDFLASISFEAFIHYLPKIYLNDEHLIPQFYGGLIEYRGCYISVIFDDILRVEDEITLEFLKTTLKIDTSLQRNSTKNLNITLEWSDRMRIIVNDLYQGDFSNFGYHIHTSFLGKPEPFN